MNDVRILLVSKSFNGTSIGHFLDTNFFRTNRAKVKLPCTKSAKSEYLIKEKM